MTADGPVILSKAKNLSFHSQIKFRSERPLRWQEEQ